ncbi:MAG: flavin reductase family protein [Candidatus Woesearchaeota archaeon]|nr:MAG: flavin reductase family protein [Candidatus Woesearchaeota archaeon]
MDIAWGSEEARKFVTNVGLVTSYGKYGSNIMAAEWTHHVSYKPGLIIVNIRAADATAENIKETKEFGVSIASIEQNRLSSIAGGYSGKQVDKIGALNKLGFKFYKGKKIKALMVEDAALNVECKLIKEIELGDHTMFVGEAVDVKLNDKEPLAYNNGKYWKLTETLKKPSDAERENMKKTVEEFKK